MILTDSGMVPAGSLLPASLGLGGAKTTLGAPDVSANGCHSNSQTFQYGIPQIENVDLTYQDPNCPLGGIEVHISSKNGKWAIGNWGWLPANAGVTVTLSASGGGTWVDGGGIGGGFCEGASGANISVILYAHYK